MNITFTNHSAIKIIIRKGTWKSKWKIIWKLDNMIVQNQLVKEQITETINNFIEGNDHDTSYQNLWDVAKAARRGKFIFLSAYINKS